jgi:hypothetical protein
MEKGSWKLRLIEHKKSITLSFRPQLSFHRGRRDPAKLEKFVYSRQKAWRGGERGSFEAPEKLNGLMLILAFSEVFFMLTALSLDFVGLGL